MIKTQPLNLLFEEVWTQISPEIKDTFDLEQISAIKISFDSRNFTHHPLDLRISFPFSRLSFYLIFLAGKERRSKERLQFAKALHPLWTPINSVFLVGALIILSTSTFAILSSALSSIGDTFSSLTPSPTSIPWIDNESECNHTGRTWRNDKCWDYEHNPMF